MKPLLIAVTLVLAGCVTEQQVWQQFENECSAYGYTSGTTVYGNCMQTQHLKHQAAHQNLSRADHNALSIGQNSNVFKSQQSNCTTRYYNNVVYTDCY